MWQVTDLLLNPSRLSNDILLCRQLHVEAQAETISRGQYWAHQFRFTSASSSEPYEKNCYHTNTK